jgi:threonine dehydrogenase-like Zn-dependent dehydrogenase
MKKSGAVPAMTSVFKPVPVFDKIIECSGTESGFITAVSSIKPQGTIIQKSTFNGTTTVDMSRLVVNEISVIGSRCGPFKPALRALSKGLKLSGLVHSIISLEQVPETLKNLAGNKIKGKVLVKI